MNRYWVRVALVVSISIALAQFAAPDSQAASVAGSQGTDTRLPATDSQVTVQGRGEFDGLRITINQTADLNNQAVSISWTGATPTSTGPGRFGAQYLQIMQCWGDDDGAVPDNPGPPPEQCVQGASAATYGGLGGIGSAALPNLFATSRIVSRTTWSNFDTSVGVVDPKSVNVWRPFRAVDGTVVDAHIDPDFNPSVVGGQFWLNPFFNIITTNEIPGAATGPDGQGSELFEVQTGLQSSGLGCGQRVQPVAGGGKKVPQCWIVVVPRGRPEVENEGTPFGGDQATQFGVATSPLAPQAWRNRIAIPLQFNPVDSPCALGADERRISGNELALPAVANWQPALCAGEGASPFSYAPVGDAAARQQLLSTAIGGPGMVIVNQAFPAGAFGPQNPVVYAPVSASGVVIGFNVERNPRPDAPDDAQRIAGVRVGTMNLTPRLVAKLLTQSYRAAVNMVGSPGYSWLADNPNHLALDPDFLRFNPEFSQLQIADSRTFSGLQLPQTNSDATAQVWRWILADPEAKAWLDGEADEWGMRVNPQYSTDPADNPSGNAFGTPLPSSFPKAEPYCYQSPPVGLNGDIVPAPLCSTDWMPYTRGYGDSARLTRIAFDGARVVLNQFATAASNAWTRDIPQLLGRRGMLALTDSPSAAQYGLQTARLSRAGDTGDDRAFIAPDRAGMSAGVAAMVPGADSAEVLETAPSVDAPEAYPLTIMSYAAVAPLKLDAAAREDYAAFLDYAATNGQEPGSDAGRLPAGYVPLPDDLSALTAVAAGKVRTLTPAPVPTTSAPTSAVGTGGSTVVTTARRPTSTGSRPTTPPAVAPPVTEVPAAAEEPPEAQVPAPGEEAPGEVPAGAPRPTPVVSIAASRLAVPVLGALALAAGLIALELTKRPRRRAASPSTIEIEAA